MNLPYAIFVGFLKETWPLWAIAAVVALIAILI